MIITMVITMVVTYNRGGIRHRFLLGYGEL